jgi:hypothetical protein
MLLFAILTPFTGLKDISEMLFDFPLSTPFRPYEQLMGVLPLVNKDNIPSAYHVNISLLHAFIFLTRNRLIRFDVRSEFTYYPFLPARL